MSATQEAGISAAGIDEPTDEDWRRYRKLQAPGRDEADRVRRTKWVVERIPGDVRIVGRARMEEFVRAVAASCDYEDGFDIVVEFYESRFGEDSDPVHEIYDLWDEIFCAALPKVATVGYEFLVDLADNPNHPWRDGPSKGPTLEYGLRVLKAAHPRALDAGGAYVVEDLVRAGTVGEVIGDYGVGKTWLLSDLALSVAFGKPFLGKGVREGPVLYLGYEGQWGLWERWAAWLHDRNLLPDNFTLGDLEEALAGRILLAKEPPLFDDVLAAATFLQDTIEALGIGLVIIDTRGKSLGPSQREDSADTANQVNAARSRIAQATGCTFISAHHTGHGAKSRGRGSSGWTQGSDFAFCIEGNRDDFSRGGPVTLVPVKQRDGRRPEPASFRLELGITLVADGTTWETGVLRWGRGDGEQLSLQARVFHCISQEPGCSLEHVRQNVAGGNPRIDRAIREILELGAIEDRGATNRHSYHVVEGWHVTVTGDVEGGRKRLHVVGIVDEDVA